MSVVAELLLIKRLQISWNRENDSFWAGDPKFGDEADPTDVELLRQLAHRQNAIRKLFERIMQNMQIELDEEEGK